jgi:L-lactate permease
MTVLIIALLAHFVADFLLQDREMGKNKSEKISVLAQHVAVNVFVTTIFLVPFVGLEKALIFSSLNGLVHGFVDWNIWRSYKAYAMRKIKEDAQAMAKKKHLTLVGKSKEEVYMEKVAFLMEARSNFKFWEDHWFYVTMGADQFLHTVTIVVLWSFLIGG